MPLINGLCVPPICLNRKLIAAGATLEWTRIVGVKTHNPVDVTAKCPDILKKGLQQLEDAARVKCDGCTCFVVMKYKPPLQMTIPRYEVERNTETEKDGTLTVNVYEVVGAVYSINSVGMCCPPGTQVQVGDKWEPIEH
jgi:hypothetical protein